MKISRSVASLTNLLESIISIFYTFQMLSNVQIFAVNYVQYITLNFLHLFCVCVCVYASKCLSVCPHLYVCVCEVYVGICIVCMCVRYVCVSVSVSVHAWTCHGTCVDVREQIVSILSLLLPLGDLGSNLGHRIWQQALLSTESPCHLVYILQYIVLKRKKNPNIYWSIKQDTRLCG